MSMVWDSERTWRSHCQAHWGVPAIIDLWDFVHNKRELCGAFPINVCDRALEDLLPQPLVRDVQSMRDDELGVVWFEIKGDLRAGERASLRLKLQAKINLTCQRCLDVMSLEVMDQVRFDVMTQAQFEKMDQEEIDPDEVEMLVGSRKFDLMGLLEDQLILLVPYVPKHDECQLKEVSVEPPPEEDSKPNPFEVLGQIKRKN